MSKTRTLRLTDKEVHAIEALAAALNISGQRGATFQPFIQWLAETASAALPETAAALEIAAGCAAGGEWEDLAIMVEPVYSALCDAAQPEGEKDE